MSEPYDFDRELEAVERFIAAVQAGQIGTSDAMAAYRDRHRPAIERLRAELASFQALLDEAAVQGDVGAEPEASGSGAPELWQAEPDEPDPGTR